MTMRRAFSVLQLKSVDDDKRSVEGIATTPTVDRMGDVVMPEGAEYALPIPLLWQHDANQPVGHVLAVKSGKSGITIKAKIFKAETSENLIKRLDEAWESVKLGLVRGLSIGFKPLEDEPLQGMSLRFLKWEWLELSLVTVPANADATIQVVRGISEQQIKRNVARIAPGVIERVRSGRPGAIYSTRR